MNAKEIGAKVAEILLNSCLDLEPIEDGQTIADIVAEQIAIAQPKAGEEIVRVLRLVEFEGPRELVEKQIAHSVHGTRVFQPKPDKKEVRITAVTLDCFPEVLELARQSPEPALLKELRERIQRLEAQVKRSEEE